MEPKVEITLFQHSVLGHLAVFTDSDGTQYFKAQDVCISLQLFNTSTQLKRHVKPKWIKEVNDGYSKSGKALYVTEAGLNALMFKAKTPQALLFQDWVFEDVLPKIRKDGGYISPDATQEQLAALQQEINSLIEKNMLLTFDNKRLVMNNIDSYVKIQDELERKYKRAR